MDNDKINFNQFSAKVYENDEKHSKALKDLCVIKSVVKPSEFFESLEKHMQQDVMSPKSHFSQDSDLGPLADFAELFKSFEEYPSNLRKIPPKKRIELQRTNSTILKGSGTDLIFEQPGSTDTARLDGEPTAKHIYRDYQKFKEKLFKITKEASAKNEDDKGYQEKIKQIQGFAQQLDKLMPKEERDCSDAFTSSEAEKLKAIADNLEQLNYLRSQENVRLLQDTSNRDLEVLVEILSNTLMQISCFING